MHTCLKPRIQGAGPWMEEWLIALGALGRAGTGAGALSAAGGAGGRALHSSPFRPDVSTLCRIRWVISVSVCVQNGSG